ncbi:MAG: hypothetical protein IJ500_02205 [Alphaproteobacteria bacterium]|nr:hypothetical protein [Alphaproteobacteria bacterium]MBQ8729387.1 hypothetical protein [Alphaproteobacteria bacterium]
MTRKIFLTSVIAMGIVCGAGAARAESFPSSGYMQENKTYESAATYKNTGVYDGEVSATAEYTDTMYQIAAGTYLPAASEGVTESCPANSYCPGASNVTYNATAAQGLTSCPSSYPNSSTGASKQTQCYTACTLSVANIAHATAVTGNDYYGTGTDTCAATACENGYHVLNEIGVMDTTPLISVDYTESGDGYAYISASGNASNSNLSDAGLTENNTWASHFDYGTVYGHASCQPTDSTGLMEAFNGMQSVMNGDVTAEEYESQMTDIIGAAKAAYMADLATGMMDGSKTEYDMYEAMFIILGQDYDADYDTSSTGQYCWCQMTGYKPTDGEQSSVAAAPWVSGSDFGSADYCASYCAGDCANYLRNDRDVSRAFRAAVFGSRGALAAGTCEANEISITWTDAAPEDVAANNAGMCTYGGDIRTPVKAATIPGKTFKGWKFVKVN